MNIKKIIKACLPYGIVEFLKDSNFSKYRNSKYIFRKYYKEKQKKPVKQRETTKKIIYVVDGREDAGGLSDRFMGMVSLYKISKELNVDYKISMTSPVDLTNYLVPNKYNWIINENELIYDARESIVWNLPMKGGGMWIGKRRTLEILQSLFKKWNQIHITTNIESDSNREYGELFNELFKPTDELKMQIDNCLQEIGCDFISATFRFQKLLGDFSDGKKSVLPEAERLTLINRCIEHIIEIYKENNYKKVLVTSDSISFLDKAKELDFVYVIPGTVTHFDVKSKEKKEVFIKSFLDYFLLTHSKLVYLIIDGQMYDSAFPYKAALHNFPYKIKRY